MAGSTRKSLASTAASAARKMISRTSDKKAAPAKKAAPSKKAASAKKSAPAKKAAPAKKSAPAKKAAPSKKAASAKSAPAKKAAPAKKSAPAKKAAPAKKSAPAKKAAPAKKSAPAKKAAPAKKSAPAKKTVAAVKKSAPAATKPAPAKKAAPAKKSAPAKKTAKKTVAQGTAKKTVTTARTGGAAAKSASTEAGSLRVKEGEGAWTRAELKEVVSELQELRAKVVRTLEEQEAELAGLMRDAGDGAGQDQADMGATSFERDHELSVVNNEREKLAQIDRALARIADGSYGICESCGTPIGKMRVMAFPRATLCLTCKQREERR